MPKPQEHNYRPSALPMLAQCPKFRGAESEYTNEGKKRHNALADYLRVGETERQKQGKDRHGVFSDHFTGNKKALEKIPEHLREDLEWAIEYVEMKAPIRDWPMVVEGSLESTLPNGLQIFGTPDIVCGPKILDLKWRPRDYAAQMAAYAFMVLDQSEQTDKPFPEVESFLLFGSTQTVRSQKWTKESAWRTIQEIITNVESAWAAPTPCEYCGWCGLKRNCEALTQQVNIALASNPEWNLPQWHSSEMNTAKELSLALTIARTLKDWCESVEFHAKEKAVKEGIIADGFQLQTRQGNRVIDDIQAAFANANLPQDEFIKACSVKLKALIDTYAEFHGMKKAPAERDIEQRLKAIIQRKSPTAMLVKERKPKKSK